VRVGGWRRVWYTAAVLLLLAQAAHAQSVLNFPRSSVEQTGIAIINPNTNFADVQLTFYGLDGTPLADGAVNPVNYRIGPKSELQMMARDLFVAARAEGWIQATSSSPGLTGFYFTGDFSSKLDGSPSAPALTAQVLPLIREDVNEHTDLLIINPGNVTANISILLYNLRGEQIAALPRAVPAHGAFKFRPSQTLPIFGTGTSARVNSSVPVTATAIIGGSESLMSVNGQSVELAASVRVIPHFLSGNGANSQLLLANPNSAAMDATVTIYSAGGGPVHPSKAAPSSRTVNIPAHGLVSLDAASIAGLPVAPTLNGWLKVETANLPLNGVAVVDGGSYTSSIPLQRAAATSMLFSQLSDSADLFTELDLVNPSSAAATVDVSIIRRNGTLIAQKKFTVGSNAKISEQIRTLIPEAGNQLDGFVSIRSSVGVYAVEMLGGTNQRFNTTVVPQRANLEFTASPTPDTPRIVRLEPGNEVTPGTILRLNIKASAGDVQVLLGNLTLSARVVSASSVISVDIPAIEPGYTKLRIRVRGVESEAIQMHILPADDRPLRAVSGLAFYQKIEVTDSGLDLNHPAMNPIRNARVEVLDTATRTLLSVSETGEQGEFVADVPEDAAVTIRVMSRQRSTNLQVADNTSGNALYSISSEFDWRENQRALIVDRGRSSGAFNILEMVQRSNELVRLSDPSLIPPAPTIYWSVRNTRALIGTTFFSVNSNTARILGDRNDDSDEFDDAVITHEYGHLLAARFSRDDSPGGVHGIGDTLDPRLAWSEGWANFFSGVVRNDSVFRDSRGPNGAGVMRFDMEDNQPPNDQPGYGSEASIHSLLWDMFDGQNDAADTAQYPFSAIWEAFIDMKNDRFVYLPYFLERFLALNPADMEAVRAMAQVRSIDFFPNVRPSVSNPWPRPLAVGAALTGSVDSFSEKRDHLARSAHFFTFTLASEQTAAVRLSLTGLGAGANAGFNDLDMFLTDMNGNPLDKSERGLNGQPEMITRRLPAGTYMVEVRSFYKKAETNSMVYNSGDYSIIVLTQ
jgi:hypothetical protein